MKLAILLLVGCFFGIIACESTPAGTSTPIPTPTPIIVEVVDSAGNIIALYESNEIAAAAKYTGRWADINGAVEDIESKGSRIEVNLAKIGEMFVLTTIVCKVSEEDAKSVVNL